MEKAYLLDYINNIMKTTNYGCSIFEGEKCIQKINRFAIINEEIIKKDKTFYYLFKSEKTVNYYVEENSFLIAFFKPLNTNYTFIIGPVRMTDDVDESTKQIYEKHRDLLKDYAEAKRTLLEMPKTSLEKFLCLLTALEISINDNKPSFEEPIISSLGDEIESVLSRTIAENADDETNSLRAVNHEYENRLSYIIKNGLIDEIDELEKNQTYGKVGISSPNNLRQVKNLLLTLNTICLRAAIEGGLYEETAYNLGEIFSKTIESTASFFKLQPLSRLIKREYCKKVRQISRIDINDQIIYKATKYIYTNIYGKITAKDVAQSLNITPEYLSAKFSKVLGCSIPEFINKQKINEAKQLLKFSDKSLSTISAMLGFSSQSYFQNQFKKYRGMTPLEYRNSKSN